MNKLGNLVKMKREEKGLSLRELAKRCNLSHSYIDSIEKGYDGKTKKAVSPTIETIEKLATGLNIAINDLLTTIGILKMDNPQPIPPNLEVPLPSLSPDEMALLEKYRRMKDNEKDTMHKVADTIAPDDQQAAALGK
jgi:transcriptional regulator with XRE-family HTH domain